VVDVGDLSSLRRALTGTRAVISTVMPFSENGFCISQAAAEMGLAYTDPSGETGFVRRLAQDLDDVARNSGATLCPGNGAAAFLGDIALHSILEPDKDQFGGVLYDIRNYQPTWGSFKSYVSYILPDGGARIREGQIESRPFAFCSASVQGISGFHSVVPDALVVSRYWHPQRFDALGKSTGLPRVLIRCLALAITDSVLGRLLLRMPFDRWLAYDAAKDANSTITAHVEIGSGGGTCKCRTVTGRGIYPLTGRILAATINAMLSRNGRPTGVRAASEMFTSFEQAIEQTGVVHLPEV
jgi:hypothetical protein